jgi:mannosyltransferase OCH1-like enzyme
MSRRVPLDVCIPKNIFQTWKTHEVPSHWKESPKSIKRMMPGWNYYLTDDNDNLEIVKKHFPKYLKFYESLTYPIQRADMIRPILLYLYGGIYIDLDFIVLKPLDPLFSSGDLFFIQSGNTSNWMTNSFMASKAGHPFWLEYLEAITTPTPGWAFGKHFTVMTSTGPIRLSNVIYDTSHVYSVLPRKDVMPCSVCDVNDFTCTGGYLKGIRGQSWNSMDSLVLNFLLCNWRPLLIYLLCVIVIIYITKRMISKSR